MKKLIRCGIVFAAMLIAIVGAGAALAYDDGDEAPFVVGTEISNAFGSGGVVVANINGKSYVWDQATDRCWAYQMRPIKGAGYTTTMVVPIENITGTCDRYKPKPAPAPSPTTVCERVPLTMGYTYRMPVIESGGYAYGAVPSTSIGVCTTVQPSMVAPQ